MNRNSLTNTEKAFKILRNGKCSECGVAIEDDEELTQHTEDCVLGFISLTKREFVKKIADDIDRDIFKTLMGNFDE